MVRWPFGTHKREEEFARLELLASLPDEADRDAALRLVAGASAAALPKGDRTGERYLANPGGSFGIREARGGTVDGVEALLVWTDSSKSPAMTGGVSASSGSASGETFAFATLPRDTASAALWPRPRRVPVSAESGIGHPQLDDRYLVAADDPSRTFTQPVIAAFLAAPPHTFGWTSIWDDHVCAHSGSPPGEDGRGDALVRFAVSVSRAMGTGP
jgi:hypothetical protein